MKYGGNTSCVSVECNDNLFIFDAQYTKEEYSGSDGSGGRKGWGHSAWNDAVEIAQKSQSKKLVLFHHGREDKSMESVLASAQEHFSHTLAASEGLEMIV